MRLNILWLAHNCVVHPVAGLLWFVGLTRAGDCVHRWVPNTPSEGESKLPQTQNSLGDAIRAAKRYVSDRRTP